MFLTKYNNSYKLSQTLIFLIFSTSVTLLTLYYYQTSRYNHFLNVFIDREFSKNYRDFDIQEEDLQNGYIVWSSVCRIPRTDPFHEAIRKFIFKWNPVSCSTRQLLTYTSYDSQARKHSIVINTTALPEYGLDASNVKCCYSSINRKYVSRNESVSKTLDNRNVYSPPVCFNNQTKLSKGTEFVYVECSFLESNSPVVFNTIHGMVANKADVKPKPTGNKTYSVLLLGIDSISRLNLKRAMPKTWQYLQDNHWISLEGYNKIDENTLPNLGAVLTGITEKDMRKVCWKNDEDVFDECPFIWKEYKRNSYITAYVEDSPEIGTFNYEKAGFRNSPTDYYVRPLMIAGAEKLKIKYDGNRAYCMGESTQAEYLLQYVSEFAQRFQNFSYFNLFWLNSFSHDELNQPQLFDERYKKFLEDLLPYLNSTIVIFFSDHGMRFGDIRLTYVGWLEERLPFLSFLLPPSFKENFPAKYENLIYNTNRLTSPFDLHATLQDILYGSVQRKPQSCSSCDTLFTKVPFNRTCENAGIPSYWCTCSSNAEDTSTTDTNVLSKTHFVLQKINQYLMTTTNNDTLINGSSCAVLSLGKIISARIQKNPSIFSSFISKTYVIVFETNPSRAIFETTVQSDDNFNVEDMVSRINAYGNQSSCILGASKLKNFCFCIENTNGVFDAETSTASFLNSNDQL